MTALVFGALFLLFFGEKAQAAGNANLYLGRADVVETNTREGMPIQLVSVYKSSSSNYYFFIPGNWDAENLRIFMDGTDAITLDKVSYASGDYISLPLDQKMKLKVYKNGATINLTVMQLSDLPTIYIETESGKTDYIHKSKQNKEAAIMYMVDPDGTVEYDGKLDYIRIRGNSTANYPKKPYQIKLDKKTSLCGMQADKKYILLANYVDKAAIRNTMALDMARYSGAYAFVPAAQSVNVYVNHEYAGLYLLTEKAEIDKNRLNITDLEDALEKMNSDIDLASTKARSEGGTRHGGKKYHEIPLEPEDYTGGYLLQGNKEMRYKSEESGFITSRGYFFTLQQPKYATEREINYIAELFQSIEDAIFASDGIDPRTGKYYTELVDFNTFVHRYMQIEVTDDYDILLSYMYKDSDSVDGMVYYGPVWDQDNIFGTGTVRNKPARLRLPNSKTDTYNWMNRAAKHTDFRNAAIEAYNEVYKHALAIFLGEESDPTGTLRSVDEYVDEVRLSAEADLVLYPSSLRTKIANLNPDTGKNFEANIKYLKRYIKDRKAALDKAYDLGNIQ